jgi:uncharacterized membrane protein
MTQDAQAQPELTQAQPQPSVDSTPSLQQFFEAIDPRTVAGGFLGLVTGEAIGGTIGSVVGGVFLGPAGMVAGAGIGAFTGSMIGQKVASDTIADLVKIQAVPSSQTASVMPHASTHLDQVGGFLNQKIGERAGEVVGIAAGSTVGMVIAGPIGGAIGATLGSTLGGQLGEDWIASAKGEQAPSSMLWLQRFGITTVGETGTAVVGAAVGTVFLGVPGRRLGERIGTIVGKRIEWHSLAFQESPLMPPSAQSGERPNSTHTIVHRVRGYIRFRIPQLRASAAWAEQLQQTVAAWTGVTQVRMSLAASSIAITYDAAQIAEATIEQKMKLVLSSDR